MKNKKLFLLLLIIPLIVFFIGRSFALPDDEEEEEIEDDNWEISTALYDSTVDNGLTPLTEINWDASAKPYNEDDVRVITVQITYRNRNTISRYDVGDLRISIPNLIYGYSKANLSVNINTSANDSTHSGYDWNFSAYSLTSSETYIFTNNVPFEERASFEGTIQIVYTITSREEATSNTTYLVEKYDNQCTHNLDKVMKASLYKKVGNTNQLLIESNETKFSFTRTYIHEWQRLNYELTKTTKSQVSEYDMFGDNPEDYIWVKFNVWANNVGYNDLPVGVIADSKVYYEYISEGAKVYKTDGTPIVCIENKCELLSNETLYYVAYPKSIYNAENNNMIIPTRTEVYGIYENGTDLEYLAEKQLDVNLADFIFNKDRSVLNKYIVSYYSEPLFYQALKNQIKSEETFDIDATAYYLGETFNYKICDDAVYVIDGDIVRKLDDNEYRFTKFYINPSEPDGLPLKDGLQVELWVRYKNESDYTLYDTYSAPFNYNTVEFPNDVDVVSMYFLINNWNQSIKFSFHPRISFKYNPQNQTGKFYNTSYSVVYEKNENDEYEIVTFGERYTGSDKALKLISSNDYDENGYYLIRSTEKISWSYFQSRDRLGIFSVKIESGNISQDAEQELFKGNYRIGMQIHGNGYDYENYVNYSQLFEENAILKGYILYDLLPLGMNIDSTSEEIKESMRLTFSSTNGDYYGSIYSWTIPPYHSFYRLNSLTRLKSDEIKSIFKNNSQVQIIENWNNTGRTMIKIVSDFTDENFMFFGSRGYSDYVAGVDYTIRYSVSYDSYMEYGKTWENESYAEFLNPTSDQTIYKGKVVDALDINNNDDTDYISKSSKTTVIDSVFSTNQDVQVSAKTNDSLYSTNKQELDTDTEYTYKLRVRTGKNDITNLVIYDSLSGYTKNSNLEYIMASGGKQHWQGELLDIDTSYAESKGYTVKVYYNENLTPGSLTEDGTWQEYSDNTDKSKVKMLAFEYLDADDEPVVLPANSLTYVLIKMKSPVEDYITYSYNGCWTEWNAIDPITERPVDFITGINSNIVKLSLPHSTDIEDIELSLAKKWIDGNDALNTRPENVTYRLIPNGDNENVTDVVITGSGNEWSTNVSVPELDMLGNEIEYTVTENPIQLNGDYKYVATINGLTITNTLYKDITLTKVWKDNSDSYLTRPESITYKVKQNGNDYQTVTFNGNLTSNEWSKVITVPVYDTEGNEYTYTVDELDIDGYSKLCEGLTCTNTLSGNDTITVKKVWIDSENEYNTRPNSIDIKIKQNDTDYQTVHLTGTTNTWESEEITVPKYDSNGVKYEYTISETQLNKYGLVTYDQSNYQVTNTLKENMVITVTKQWIDGANEQGIRPNELKINLLQNNNQYQELTLRGDTDTWTTTVEVPKYDDNQVLYTYSIKELTDNVNEDYSNITYSENELKVTNKLEKKKDITISKTWDDSNNKYLTRPDKVTINLLRNGELYQELELSNNTLWKKDITDLDVYDANGKLYKYTIEENVSTQLSRYKTITYDQTSYTITNKLTDIPKVSLYFNVKNGYTASGSNDMQFDSEGLNNILRKYKINGDDPYEFNFKLENIDTGEIVTGKLSTQGNLKFEDIPYGTYRASEEKDKYFVYVLMNEIEAVNGVTFKEDENGGTITITPTGEDILYGVNVVNKIEYEPSTPITSANRNLFIYLLILLIVFIGLYFYKKEYMK